MPICSYLVFPESGARQAVCRQLSEIPGCEFVPAENRDLILLVTETETSAQEEALRERVEALPEIRSLLLAFGEVTSAQQSPPVGASGGREVLPVLHSAHGPTGGRGRARQRRPG
jgi:nitrate reductase NapAB chaperone NapD